MEEFLNPAVNGWYIQQAHELISDACHMITLLEKGQYTKLSEFLEKKESYLAVLQELEKLVDKYKLREWIQPCQFSEPTDEELLRNFTSIWLTNEEWITISRDQDLWHRHNQLIHADKLVARDYGWRGCFYDSD